MEIIVIFNLFLSCKNFIDKIKKTKNNGIVIKSTIFENETNNGLSSEIKYLVNISKYGFIGIYFSIRLKNLMV